MTAPKTLQTAKKNPSVSVKYSLDVFNVFRYLTTLLLGTAKLGMWGVLPAANLSHVSWWIVLLPSFFLELSVLSLIVIGGLVAVVVFLLYLIWLSISYVISQAKYRKKLQHQHAPWEPVTPSKEARERLSARLKSDHGLADRMLGRIFNKPPKNE